MKRKKLVIASTNPELYTTRRLLEEAKKTKLKVEWINPYQSTLPQKTGPADFFFHRSTGTNYDDFDLLFAEAQAIEGARILNPLPVLRRLRSKDQQWLFMLQHELPHIPTFAIRGRMHEQNWSDIQKWKCNEQYILKMTRGNQGIGVNLINGKQSLSSILETFAAMRDQRFILQPFVAHKKEWRILTRGEEILASIEKTISERDFRGNAKRAQTKVIKRIPHNLRELALQAARLAGVDYAGIDILEDEEGVLRLLEINPIPGFEAVEELTGLNIAGELLHIIL